ncbi:hypothetical protein Bca4012_027148 [Brassica carinata]
MELEIPKRLYAEGLEPQVKKINNCCRMQLIRDLKEAMSADYDDVKKDPVFTHIMAISENKLKFSRKLVDTFIFRQLITSKMHEKWFVFARMPLRSSLQEYHTVTGLKISREGSTDVVKWKNDMGFWSEQLRTSGKISLQSIKNEHLKGVHKLTRIDRMRLIYLCVNTGVVMGEMRSQFQSERVREAAMSDIRHRILPPKFLSENPKEAGFCLWLLHPVPSCRPSTRDILQSEVVNGIPDLYAEGLSLAIEQEDSESELLQHFLVLSQEQRQKHAGKLMEELVLRPDRDLLRNRDENVISEQVNSETWSSDDRVGAFFDGLCKYARYSKFETRGVLRTGELNNTSNVICSLGFDRDEDYFATAGVSKKIKIFEFNSLFNESVDIHYPAVEMSNRSKLSGVCWNNYIRNYLASSDYDGIIKLWDVTTGQAISHFIEHEKRAWSVDFSEACPTKLASGSDDCSVKLWNINEACSSLPLHA